MPEETHGAAYGLIGALIGGLIAGLASFGGVYLTTHEEQSSNTRNAYVSFVAKADQYSWDLVELQNNPKVYSEIRGRLNAEVAPLYSAETLIRFLDNKKVGDAAGQVITALFQVYIPADRKDLDVEKVENANDLAKKRLDEFTQIAEAELAAG